MPILTLPWDKETIGNAIGIKRDCTVCAINDIGMANAIAGKLVYTHTINDTDGVYTYMNDGVDGFYTDTMTPAGFQARYDRM